MDAVFRTIILLGAIQGIIAGILLFYSSSNRQPNRILAVLIGLMALAGFNLYFEYTGWFYSSTTIAIIHALIPMIIIMPIGPLILFYIRACLEPDFRINKKYRLYFYPVIIDLVPQLTAGLFILGVLAGWFEASQQPWGLFIDTYNIYADIPRWLYLSLFVWLSWKYIVSREASNKTDPQQVAKIKWLRLFIIAFIVFQCIWLLYLIPYVIPPYNQWILSTFDWYPVYIPMAILIYWLGIKGYIMGVAVLNGTRKKIESGFSGQAIEQTIKELTRAMETDRLYLNPSLNINELAKQVRVPPKIVSFALNNHIGISFNEYVNQFRVKEFQRKLLQKEWEHLTISGLALECGFNSKASFQRIFKQQTGMSPTEFRKSASGHSDHL